MFLLSTKQTIFFKCVIHKIAIILIIDSREVTGNDVQQGSAAGLEP